MKLAGPIKELGSIDQQLLAKVISTAPESTWLENQFRQQQFDVHYKTESIVMLFCDCESWPTVKVSKESGWELLSAYALPIMHAIIDKYYPKGGKVIRAMVAKLPSASIIKPHIDAHPSFSCAHRIHIPITTDLKVRFTIGGQPFHLQTEKVYEINNQLQHSVMNKSNVDRITFIFDYVPPENLSKIELISDCIDI